MNTPSAVIFTQPIMRTIHIFIFLYQDPMNLKIKIIPLLVCAQNVSSVTLLIFPFELSPTEHANKEQKKTQKLKLRRKRNN